LQILKKEGHQNSTKDIKSAALILGDFNDVPGSLVYEIMNNNEWISGLKSSYKEIMAKNAEPTFTTFKTRKNEDYTRTIDYIWYQSSEIKPMQYLTIPQKDDFEDHKGSMVCKNYPSDHSSLLIKFNWKNSSL